MAAERNHVSSKLYFAAIISILSIIAASRADSHSDLLVWHDVYQARERGALCNDFSTAGYFIRTNSHLTGEPDDMDAEIASGFDPAKPGPIRPDWFNGKQHGAPRPDLQKWVIYLEGGGGCTTPKSCNARFINQRIREKFTTFVNGTLEVDVARAWQSYQDQPLEVISKLMTSLSTFANSTKYRGLHRYDENSTTPKWGVEGESLLSTSPSKNPDFHEHNHVLIPYCSSDLWLKKTRDYQQALSSEFHFQFNPSNINDHQFTFRGATIFRSVVKDLFDFHGLSHAAEVILAGSSAGGVGVMNHAGWLLEELRVYTGGEVEVFMVLDSSWFIDFRGEITDFFPPEEIEMLGSSSEIIDTCSSAVNSSQDQLPSDHNEGVGCVSAPLFLSAGKFPVDVPIFALFSRYDLYLLVQALAAIDEQTSMGDVDILELMRVVSEYSGSMNSSLQGVAAVLPSQLSYYVTSCFQHVYLATSSLWGEGALLGTASVDGSASNNMFQHNISSSIWDSFHLQHRNHTPSLGKTTPISIPKAIHLWMLASSSDPKQPVRFHDDCDGPYCNQECPETVILGAVLPYWETLYQVITLVFVFGVAGLGVVVKVWLSLRDMVISIKQKTFLKRICTRFVDESESALPFCTDAKAIAIACLDICYSVTVLQSTVHTVTRTSKASVPQRNRLMSIALAVASPTVVGGVGRLEEETEETGKGSLEDCKDMMQDRRRGYSQLQEQSFLSIKPKHFAKKTPKKMEIIKGISTYFNPGELVAIMGPSGSGKTTFLDLLAGRRRDDTYQGEILVNGVAVDQIRDWYIANTGYVLQLATPYYEELTVRENLTLAAQIRLPKTLSLQEKFERVEKVMDETGLTSFGSVQVGGSIGPGLSGGQKRRLCVAIQLLNMPSLLLLDEPTSGLDATSSLELLNHLHRVASSNRTVILTIHQPRLEIFHMFHKILLLCQGQIAYYGIPDKVYEVFLEAYRTSSLPRKRIDSLQNKNPADMIMDMLQSVVARKSILSYYQKSEEPEAIRTAIEESCRAPGGDGELQTKQRVHQEAGIFNRLSALEARASKQAKLVQVLYLPLIFLVYGTLLGTVYYQSNGPTFILSAFGVFSCASGLFMFPAVYTYLFRAIEIFSLELADGVGSPLELVLQTFFRYSTLALLPIVCGSIVIYLLVIPVSQYNLWVLVQLTIFNVALNHTWVSLLVCVIMFQPFFAHRLSPVISAVAGFSGGFFVPPALMPPWYQWLFYINPNFFGFSAMARVLLQDLQVECPHQSTVECYPTSSRYILTYFSLHITNPYLNILILMAMSAGYLVLAWMSIALRHSYLIPRIKKYLQNRKKPAPSKSKFRQFPGRRAGSQFSSWTSASDEIGSFHYTTQPASLVPGPQADSMSETCQPEFKKVAFSAPSPPPEEETRRHRYRNRRDTISRMLRDGETHRVWKPGRHHKEAAQISFKPEQRQKTLLNRINTYHRRGKGEKTAPITLMQRRMEQWKNIEDEAMRLNAREAEMTGAAAKAAATNQGFPGGREGMEIAPRFGMEGERRGSARSNLSQTMLTIMEEDEEMVERKWEEEVMERKWEEEVMEREWEEEEVDLYQGEEDIWEEIESEVEGEGEELEEELVNEAEFKEEDQEQVEDKLQGEAKKLKDCEKIDGGDTELEMESFSLVTLSASPSPHHSAAGQTSTPNACAANIESEI